MIIEAYRGHGVWGIIENIQSNLESFSEEVKEDPRYKEFCEKLDYTKWLLETSNCAFFNENELQSISQHMNSVNQHLPNNANNWLHYGQVSNGFGAVFGILPYPRIKKIFRSDANVAIEEFTTAVSALKTEMSENEESTEAKINEEVTKLESFIGAGKAEVEGSFEQANIRQTELHGTLSEIQSEVSGLETRMQAQFEVWEANNTSQITDKLSEISGVFAQAQSERSEVFQNQKNQFSSSLANLKDSIKTVHKENSESQKTTKRALDEAQKGFLSQGEGVIKSLNEFYEKAGQTVLSGDFITSAAEEKKLFEDNAWYAKGFLFCAAASLGVIWYLLAKEGSFKFSDLLMRLPVSIVILIPGFYFASLANQHRKSAVTLRSLGLRIKAFDAYLVNASDDKREELRSELAKVFFVDQASDKERRGGLFGQGEKHVGGMVNVVEKLVDKIPPN